MGGKGGEGIRESMVGSWEGLRRGWSADMICARLLRIYIPRYICTYVHKCVCSCGWIGRFVCTKYIVSMCVGSLS